MRSRVAIGLVIAILLFVCAFWLAESGFYGWTLFAMVPMLVGAVAVGIVKPDSQSEAAGLGLAAAFFSTLVFLLAGLEGIMCVAMALPITVPFGALGGWLTYRLCIAKREA